MKWMSEADLDVAQFHWFDLSGAFSNSDTATLDPIMTHRPPFEQNMVIWKGATKSHENYEMMMIVAGTDPEEGIVISLRKGVWGQIPAPIPSMVYLVDGDEIKYGPADEGDIIEKDVAELMLALVAGWYKSMDKTAEAYLPVVADTFTNRRKIAQGKKPMYDWRTVVIEPKQTKKEHLGGTHASPRLHDRRGHIRRLKSGKNVWVKSCKVGKAELGTIFHDYQIKETA
jgi:hypothetical protein